MRRWWAAGAAIVICLALGALPARSQSPSGSATTPAEYAAVTGTSDCHDVTTPGAQQFATPPYTLTHQVMACTKTASDPRVSGPATTVLNISSWDPAVVATATAWGCSCGRCRCRCPRTGSGLRPAPGPSSCR